MEAERTTCSSRRMKQWLSHTLDQDHRQLSYSILVLRWLTSFSQLHSPLLLHRLREQCCQLGITHSSTLAYEEHSDWSWNITQSPVSSVFHTYHIDFPMTETCSLLSLKTLIQCKFYRESQLIPHGTVSSLAQLSSRHFICDHRNPTMKNYHDHCKVLHGQGLCGWL